MKFLIAVLLAAPAAAADYTFTKAVEPGQLQAELSAAGVTHSGIDCLGSGGTMTCRIRNPNTSPAATVTAHVPEDLAAKIAQRRAQLIALALKLKNTGSLTPAERDNFLLLLAYLLTRAE